jgi:hypothetical protein
MSGKVDAGGKTKSSLDTKFRFRLCPLTAP